MFSSQRVKNRRRKLIISKRNNSKSLQFSEGIAPINETTKGARRNKGFWALRRTQP